MDYWTSYYGASDFSTADRASFSGGGATEWRSPDPALWPQRYGYNRVEIDPDYTVEEVTVRFEGDRHGSGWRPGDFAGHCSGLSPLRRALCVAVLIGAVVS